MDINMLKAQFVLKGKSISDIAGLLNISKSAIYRKLKGKSEFTRKEILLLISFLEINTDKAMSIFFNDKVS